MESVRPAEESVRPEEASAPLAAAAATAAVFYRSGAALTLQSLPLPAQLAPGEVLLRVAAATVCGSDVHTIRGVRSEPTPAILGHEAVGRVEVSKRPALEEGLLVTFSICDVCGTCDRCVQGLTQKCRNLMKYGHTATHDGSGLNGCYSTHLLLRAGTHIVVLPPALAANPALAAPVNCALATVMCAARAAQTHLAAGPRTRALVQGAGLLGLFACSVLRDELGFESVFCSDVVVERRQMARRFGAQPLEPRQLETGADADRELADSFDCVIEVCGNAKVIPSGLECLRPGGCYVLVGLVHPQSQLELTGQQIIRKCLTMTGVHNYAAEDLDRAVEYLEQVQQEDRYPLDLLFSPPFALSRIQDAVNQSDKFYRVLIQP